MPAPRPDYNTPLDSSNPLNADMVFATWFGEDPTDPDKLTDVSGNGNHGTLSGLDPGYAATVSGGSPAGVNGTYLPVGSEWQNDTYAIAEDPMMGAGYWVLYPIGGYPDMDGLYWGDGDITPWGSTWGTITVAQGAQQDGPWLSDGLQFGGGGGVTVAHDADISITGTLTFGFVITRASNPVGWESYFSKRTDSLTPRTNFFTNHSGTTFQFGYGGFTIGSFTCSAGNWPGTHRFVCVLQQSGANTAVTAYWDDVSVYSDTLSGNVAENTSPLYIGRNHTGEFANCVMSVAFLASRAWSEDDVADWGADIYALAEQSVSAVAASSFAAGLAVSADAPTSFAAGVDAGSTPAYVYWTDDLPGAAYGKLCIAEEDVQVVDDFGAVADQGWQLSVCDGALRYTAWFREGGCNLQGMDAVTFDFTDRKHRVRLECQSGWVRLLVDGMLLQTGGAAGPTTRTVLAWGSWIPDDF